jgi:hypothetical protein
MILWREIAYLIHLLWLRLGFGLFKRTFYIFIRPRGKKKIIGVCLSNNTKADWSQKEFDWFPFYCRKSYFVLFFKYLFVRAFGSDKSSRFLYHRHMPMCLFRFTVIFFYVLMTDVSIYFSIFFFKRTVFECLSAPLAVGTGRVSSSNCFPILMIIEIQSGFSFFYPII